MRPPHLALVLFAALLAPTLSRAETVPVPGTTGAAPTVLKSGIIGLDAMTATVFQQGQSSFSGIAVRLRIRHPLLVPNIEILPTLEYWQNTSHVDAFDIETKRRDATLAGDARWVFRNRPWQPYLGGGYGLHFLDNEVRAPQLGLPHGSVGLIKGGIEALGGIQSNPDARLGSFVELKFLDVTSYRQFKFSTGLNWNF